MGITVIIFLENYEGIALYNTIRHRQETMWSFLPFSKFAFQKKKKKCVFILRHTTLSLVRNSKSQSYLYVFLYSGYINIFKILVCVILCVPACHQQMFWMLELQGSCTLCYLPSFSYSECCFLVLIHLLVLFLLYSQLLPVYH